MNRRCCFSIVCFRISREFSRQNRYGWVFFVNRNKRSWEFDALLFRYFAAMEVYIILLKKFIWSLSFSMLPSKIMRKTKSSSNNSIKTLLNQNIVLFPNSLPNFKVKGQRNFNPSQNKYNNWFILKFPTNTLRKFSL